MCLVFADTLSANNDYPLERVAIDGVMHHDNKPSGVSDGTSLTLRLCNSNDYEESVPLSATWSSCKARPATSDGAADNQRIFAKLLPGRNYFLFAQINNGSSIQSATEDDRTVEVMFDVPSGYTLLIDGETKEYIREQVSSSDNWRKMWVVKLVDSEQPSLVTGEHMPAYDGDDYFFDIYLGLVGDENSLGKTIEGGWIRLKTKALVSNVVNRSMIDVRKELEDAEVTSSNGLPTGVSIRNRTGALIDSVSFSDGGYANEFSISFGSSRVYHVSKTGDMEVTITKTGITNTAPVKVKYEPSGLYWLNNRFTGGMASHTTTQKSGLSRTESFAFTSSYTTISGPAVGMYNNKLVDVTIDYGDGYSQIYSSTSNSSLSVSHAYTFSSATDRKFGTATVRVASQGFIVTYNGSVPVFSLAAPVYTTSTVSFCVSNDTLDRWTITEGVNSDIVRSITKEKFTTAQTLSARSGSHDFSVSYDLKETVLVKGKRDTNFDGTADNGYVTDRLAVNYYKTHTYDASLNDTNVGYVRADEKLVFTDELLDCTAGTGHTYTRYVYYTDAASLSSYFKLKGKMEPGLSWKYITYSPASDSRGRVTSIVTPIEDNFIPDDAWSNVAANLVNCVQRNYTYAPLVPDSSSIPAGGATGSFFRSEMARLMELRFSQTVSLTNVNTTIDHSNVTGADDGDLIVKTIGTQLPDGSVSTIVNKTLSTTSGEGLFGKPYESIASNGVMESYSYERAEFMMWSLSSLYTNSCSLPNNSLSSFVTLGTAVPGLLTNGWLVTRIVGRLPASGSSHSPTLVAKQSVKQVYFLGDSGLKFFEENYVCTADGNWSAPVSWTLFYYDSNGRVKAKFYSDKRREANTWTNGLCTSALSVDGITHNYTYDTFGRLLSDTKVGVTTILSETGESVTLNDVVQKYSYDSKHRVYLSRITDSSNSVSTQLTTTTLYYGDGSIKSVETSDGITQYAYDYNYSSGSFSGISITETAPSGAVTRRDFYPSGDLYKIYVTDPSGMTTGLKLFETHTYGLVAGSGGNLATRTEDIYMGESGTSSSRWTKSQTRNDGSPIRVATSGPIDNTGSASQIVTDYTYASGNGRLVSVTKTGEPTTWLFYDDAGLGRQNITVSGLANPSSGGSFSASAAVSDNVQKVDTYFGQYGSDSNWWEITDSYVFDVGATTPTLVGRHLNRLSGFCLEQGTAASGTLHGNVSGTISETVDIDSYENSTTTVLLYESANQLMRQSVTSSVSTNVITNVSVGGQNILASGSPYNDGTWGRLYYDALGRVVKQTNPYADDVVSVYVANSTRVAKQIVCGKRMLEYTYNGSSADEGARYMPSSAKTYAYSGSGGEDLPASYTSLISEETYTYNKVGAVAGVSGNASYHVAYDYDAWGQRVGMTSWQDASNQASGASVTTWTYDEPTGWAKTVANGGVTTKTITYDNKGRILSVGNARGQAVSNTYNTDGRLASSSHDGLITTYAYDRLGRVTTVGDPVVGAKAYAYNSYLQLDHVTFNGNYYGSAVRSIYPLYDSRGRSVGVALKNAWGEVVYTTQETLDSATARPTGVSCLAAGFAAGSFSIGYDGVNPNAPSTITSAAGDVIWRQDYYRENDGQLVAAASGIAPNVATGLLNRTAGAYGQLSSTTGVAAYAHFYYTHNALGQIVTEEKRGRAYDAYSFGTTYSGGIVTQYSYSPRGELVEAQTRYLNPSQYGAAPTGAMLAGRSWSYVFDDTGNLLRKSLSDDSWYTMIDVDDENRITSRSTMSMVYDMMTPGLIVDGVAAEGAKVYAGGKKQNPAPSQSALTRTGTGTYFKTILPYAATSAPVYDDEVFMVAEKSGKVSFAQRQGFVPKAQQSFASDADGNLTQDGRWIYSWNSLSQLTGMRPDPVALAAGHPATQYEYAYDSDGWRSEKRSYKSGNVERVRYLYYGNDLLAEVKVTVNASGAVTASTLSRGYHWMSGVVGEAWRLLSVQDYERGTTALPGYDGRGNVVTWTNGATGELIGTADYGPYGERFDVRWVTPADEASYNRYGFGTEYRDETGLIYYGARYYSPALGRFLSRDPAGVAGSGVNLYAFCGGDPVNNRELYGLCSPTGFWGWVGSVWNGIKNLFTGGPSTITGTQQNDGPSTPGVSNGPSAYDRVMDAVTGRYGPNKIWTELLYLAPENSMHPSDKPKSGPWKVEVVSVSDTLVLSAAGSAKALLAELQRRFRLLNDFFSGRGNSKYDFIVSMLQISQYAQAMAYLGKSVSALAGDQNSLGGTIAGAGVSINTNNGIINNKSGACTLPAVLSVASGTDGLIIQKIIRTYNVLDTNGKPVQSFDPKVNGATRITYYEAWEVKNGQIGITINGKFYQNSIDSFVFVGWPNGVSTGNEQITATMVFVPGAIITSEYQHASNPSAWWSGDLPYTTPNAPQSWNSSGGIIRQVSLTYDPSAQTWSFTYSTGKHP
jgi:RHS repeat-associated protein